ncbi:AAA family ATPase [Mesomycoplasma molare]|uniref:AAA family ATPase n=1 Tax=Mesomycoplasma molare TaxID=171288 RepID=A0ABY5TVM4_9BACT|nr:AAA family ATPase [Mesomycoplasma molare]UWD34270.1 AAA family ATPase [Mesomycoplasma molare]
MQEFIVEISFLIFSNTNKTYFVYKAKNADNKIMNLISYIPLELKKKYKISATKLTNSKYQDSYEINKFEQIIKEEKNTIINFFSSKTFPGIGKKIATKIYEIWGDNTIKILKSNPELILESNNNIPESKAKIIFNKLNSFSLEDEIYEFFISNNLMNLYFKIKENYKMPSFWKILKEDPFILLESDNDFNFYDVDLMAKKLGFDDDKNRLEYLILYKIKLYLLKNSNTVLEKNEFKAIWSLVNKEENIEPQHFFEIIKKLINKNKIVLISENHYTISIFLDEEKFILETFESIYNKKENNSFQIPKVQDKFDNIQKEAIESVFLNNLVIITGGPGTGKTEILKEIYLSLAKIYDKDKMVILTPTGRAAYLIKEKSGLDAKTIHSFLDVSKKGEEFIFLESEPKKINVLIIDEFSMVSQHLFFNLLKNIDLAYVKKIIIIGDKDQLPSIEYGNLLADFLEIPMFKINILKNNYRQKDKQEIITFSQSINKGIVPSIKNQNVFLIETSIQDFFQILDSELNILLKEYTINDWIIMAPIYEGEVGINKINNFIQNKLFDREKNKHFIIETKSGEKVFFENDKVMQLKNDYNEDISNGEIGYIETFREFNKKLDFVVVNFNNKLIKYNREQFLEQITLSYSVSVHKFQGSEVPIALFVLFKQNSYLLTKKLFYTGVTRAKDEIKIIGEKEALEYATNNLDKERKTNIKFLAKK